MFTTIIYIILTMNSSGNKNYLLYCAAGLKKSDLLRLRLEYEHKQQKHEQVGGLIAQVCNILLNHHPLLIRGTV